MQLSTSFLVSAVTLGLAGLTGAICSGNTLGVGTAAASGANTQWKIYKTTCAVSDTYAQPSTISVCDSSRFYCQFGTTNIEQYDDPVSGWAYNCTADAVTESCSGDTITRCCFPYWALGSTDSNPLNH